MADGESTAFDEKFWSDLETRYCQRIADIDQTVNELYAERDRMTSFLSDHGRQCSDR